MSSFNNSIFEGLAGSLGAGANSWGAAPKTATESCGSSQGSPAQCEASSTTRPGYRELAEQQLEEIGRRSDYAVTSALEQAREIGRQEGRADRGLEVRQELVQMQAMITALQQQLLVKTPTSIGYYDASDHRIVELLALGDKLQATVKRLTATIEEQQKTLEGAARQRERTEADLATALKQNEELRAQLFKKAPLPAVLVYRQILTLPDCYVAMDIKKRRVAEDGSLLVYVE